MPSQLQSTPGTIISDPSFGGTVAWSNPSNAAASDNVYATAALLIGEKTESLKATNFGFSIPSGANITGVKVEFERHCDVPTGIFDVDVRLVNPGVGLSAGLSAGANWPTSDGYEAFGNSTELWGVAWTPAIINNSGFGALIIAQGSLSDTAYVDHIRITVYYDDPPPGVPISLSHQHQPIMAM